MNRPLSIAGLVGIGAGLVAGLVFSQQLRQRTRSQRSPLPENAAEPQRKLWFQRNSEATGTPVASEAAGTRKRLRTALLGNSTPAPSTLLAGAGGGVLAAWGAARGGFVGTAAGLTGAALLRKLATRQPSS